MGKSNIEIRLEKKEEHQKVENLVRESFWDVYRPGCLEHYVLHQLRNDPAFVPELDFVMLLNENGKENKLIGQNMFMRTSIRADDGRKIYGCCRTQAEVQRIHAALFLRSGGVHQAGAEFLTGRV